MLFLSNSQIPTFNYRSHHKPSSSSSSNQSYCDIPSPANYQNPLELHVTEQLGENLMTRLSGCPDSFESAETLVNAGDSTELQLVEEVIRDMDHHKPPLSTSSRALDDIQIVPSTPSTSANSSPNFLSSSNSNSNKHSVNQSDTMLNGMVPSSESAYSSSNEATDELTNTLIRIVGEKATGSKQCK